MRTAAAAVFAFALLAPRAADAGLYLGGRAGVAWPSGDLEEDVSLSSQVDFGIPLMGELGWQFGNGFLLAAYLRLSPLKLDDRIDDFCDDIDAECGAVDLGLGVEGNFNFAPDEQLQPWLGGFVGFSLLGYDAELNGEEAAFAYLGWELGAQGGVDFDLAPFTVGPFVQVRWTRFTDVTIDPEDGGDFDRDIDDQTSHLWTTVGLKLGVEFR